MVCNEQSQIPRRTPRSTNDKFWQFRNLAGDDQKAELLLYGDISERSWWEDAATPKRFADDLAALGDVKEITVYINSGGGDVFAAQAIGNMLERNAATVTAHIDGLCASAATIVACHADKVVAAADGSYMVHPVSMGVCDYLTAEDHQQLPEGAGNHPQQHRHSVRQEVRQDRGRMRQVDG